MTEHLRRCIIPDGPGADAPRQGAEGGWYAGAAAAEATQSRLGAFHAAAVVQRAFRATDPRRVSPTRKIACDQ